MVLSLMYEEQQIFTHLSNVKLVLQIEPPTDNHVVVRIASTYYR
jgi:hypothetical protein